MTRQEMKRREEELLKLEEKFHASKTLAHVDSEKLRDEYRRKYAVWAAARRQLALNA